MATSGVVLGGVPRAVGLHHHHRQPVGDDVVHLARDPGPLVGGRQRDLLLGLEARSWAPRSTSASTYAARVRPERPSAHAVTTNAETVMK